jgi:hypothetical protein
MSAHDHWIRVIPTTNAAGRDFMNRHFTADEVEDFLSFPDERYIVVLVFPDDRNCGICATAVDQEHMIAVTRATCRLAVSEMRDKGLLSFDTDLLDTADREALASALGLVPA